MKPKGVKTYEAALAQLNAYIERHSMRKSNVRRIVLEQICALPQPFTAEQLEQACLEERISKGTVYNTLKLLVTAHILHAINRQFGQTAIEYEVISGNVIRMQSQCIRCGRITEIHDAAITRLMQAHKYTNFEPYRFSMFVYGECKHCKLQQKKKKEQ